MSFRACTNHFVSIQSAPSCHFSFSFSFTCGQPELQSPLISRFSAFVDYHKIWSSAQDLAIRFYHKFPENFGRLIFQDRFLVIHILFVRLVKFELFAKFPVYHLAHPVVSIIIIIIIVHFIRAFNISNSRCFFTEVWVTALLLKSPGHFLVFRQFSTKLSFGWSPLVRQPPSPLVPLAIP